MSILQTVSADRLILAVLKSGIDDLLANEDGFHKMLRGYPEDERERAYRRFVHKRPTARPAFARNDDSFPLWAVVLGAERESEEFLGNFMEIDEDEELGVEGSLEDQEIWIYVYCDHPDETRLHHQIIKSIIRGNAGWLLSQGATKLNYIGARDLAPQEAYQPDHIFVRMQMWQLGGVSVAYQPLTPPKRIQVYLEDIEIDGRPGGVRPIAIKK